MSETVFHHFESPVATQERLTLGDCLQLLKHEHVDVTVSPADAEYMKELGLDTLPDGVAVMGGAARAILMRSRYGMDVPIRDIDLVAIKGLYGGDDALLSRLSADYMPDDYSYGHGVDVQAMDAYFVTRDFTLNEILVVDGMVIATQRAGADIATHTIRATEFEIDPYSDKIGPKLKMKAALLAAVFEEAPGVATDATPESWYVGDFYIALALNKAFQYGESVTRRFMARMGYSEATHGDLYEKAINEATKLIGETDFEFRGSDIADEIMGYSMPEDQEFDSVYTGQEARAIELLRRYGGHNDTAREY